MKVRTSWTGARETCERLQSRKKAETLESRELLIKSQWLLGLGFLRRPTACTRAVLRPFLIIRGQNSAGKALSLLMTVVLNKESNTLRRALKPRPSGLSELSELFVSDFRQTTSMT